ASPVHDGETVHDAPRRNGRRHPGARGRERLRQDERPSPTSALLPNGDPPPPTGSPTPALAAVNVYVKMNVPLQPPLFSRTVHPASPSEVTVHDKKIDLVAGENPFRQLKPSK